MRTANISRERRGEVVVPFVPTTEPQDPKGQPQTESPANDVLNRWLGKQREQMEALSIPSLRVSGVHHDRASILLAGLTPEDQKAARDAEKKERIEKAVEKNEDKIKETIKDALKGVVNPIDAIDAVVTTYEVVKEISDAADGKGNKKDTSK